VNVFLPFVNKVISHRFVSQC